MENTFKINPTIKNVEVFESLLTIPQPGQSSVALPRDEGKEQLRGVCCSSKNKAGDREGQDLQPPPQMSPLSAQTLQVNPALNFKILSIKIVIILTL